MIPQPNLPASPATIQNACGQTAYVTVIGGTVSSINVPSGGTQVATASNYMAAVPNGSSIGITYSGAPTAIYWSAITPAVPASTVAVANPTGRDIAVVLGAGTVTHVAVNGTDRATASPAVVPLPAGGSIALTYSVAPVWAWMDYLDLAWLDSLGGSYAQPNLMPVSGAALSYNSGNCLPYAQHATGGLADLATAVSN